mmetsp:Transcript_55077/g.163916  ORF Transcript_55077/g.163916 Transcript_55077/m.163916 type:complete len:414 (+) Transcript_55077:1194-2435(+)
MLFFALPGLGRQHRLAIVVLLRPPRGRALHPVPDAHRPTVDRAAPGTGTGCRLVQVKQVKHIPHVVPVVQVARVKEDGEPARLAPPIVVWMVVLHRRGRCRQLLLAAAPRVVDLADEGAADPHTDGRRRDLARDEDRRQNPRRERLEARLGAVLVEAERRDQSEQRAQLRGDGEHVELPADKGAELHRHHEREERDEDADPHLQHRARGDEDQDGREQQLPHEVEHLPPPAGAAVLGVKHAVAARIAPVGLDSLLGEHVQLRVGLPPVGAGGVVEHKPHGDGHAQHEANDEDHTHQAGCPHFLVSQPHVDRQEQLFADRIVLKELEGARGQGGVQEEDDQHRRKDGVVEKQVGVPRAHPLAANEPRGDLVDEHERHEQGHGRGQKDVCGPLIIEGGQHHGEGVHEGGDGLQND